MPEWDNWLPESHDWLPEWDNLMPESNSWMPEWDNCLPESISQWGNTVVVAAVKV